MSTNQNTKSIRHRIGKAIAVAGAALLAVVLAAPPALADHRRDDRDRHHRHDRDHRDRDHRDHHRGDRDRHRARHHDHRDHRQDRGRHRGHYKRDRRPDRYGHDYELRRGHRRHYDVPRHIRHDHRHHYKRHHYKRSYFRPHRHYHEVYRFPVYTSYGRYWEYVPYCNGEVYYDGLHGSFGFYGDRVRIRIGF